MSDVIKDSFTALVERAQKNELPQIITNASFDHAVVLVKKLLLTAEERELPVSIISGGLYAEFYNKFASKIGELIETGVCVRVLIEGECDRLNENDLCRLLQQKDLIARVPENWSGTHYILVGEKAFRLETDHDQTAASASFNNSIIGGMLSRGFERAWAERVPIEREIKESAFDAVATSHA